MPWKNPRCRVCGGRTKQGKIVDADRCFYDCRDPKCDGTFIGWRHKKRRPYTERELCELAMRMRRRRRQTNGR